MSKAASLVELNELHRKVAESLKTRIELDLKDNIPTDAATLGAAIKFLKDNNVTADPADANDLNDLRDQLSAAAKKRREKLCKVIQFASDDLQVKEA